MAGRESAEIRLVTREIGRGTESGRVGESTVCRVRVGVAPVEAVVCVWYDVYMCVEGEGGRGGGGECG